MRWKANPIPRPLPQGLGEGERRQVTRFKRAAAIRIANATGLEVWSQHSRTRRNCDFPVLGIAAVIAQCSGGTEGGQLAGLSLVKRGVLEALIERTDKKIDALVYELYGLSEEEVGVVGGV